jgi:hypothetical protein
MMSRKLALSAINRRGHSKIMKVASLRAAVLYERAPFVRQPLRKRHFGARKQKNGP